MGNMRPRKIVIRCPNWVGDLVMCTPALRSIRHHFSESHISVIVKPSLKAVIENLTFFNEIIEYEPKGRDSGLKSYLSFIRLLRAKKFDLGILMPHSFSSALVFFLSSIPERVGYDRNARGWMLSQRLNPFMENSRIVPVNMVRLYLHLCAFLGCTETDQHVELKTSAPAEQWVEKFFAEKNITPDELVFIIIPGATFGSSKCWKDSYFAQVADSLIQRYRARIFIIPGPGEQDIAHSIIQKMNHKPVDLGDALLPLDLLMALIRRCSLLITNDTGPRHFGVAFNKPVVVIMGPTDARYTDYSLGTTIILREDVDCAPCHLKECPAEHQCMINITPDRVLAAVQDMVNRYQLAAAQ